MSSSKKLSGDLKVKLIETREAMGGYKKIILCPCHNFHRLCCHYQLAFKETCEFHDTIWRNLSDQTHRLSVKENCKMSCRLSWAIPPYATYAQTVIVSGTAPSFTIRDTQY